MSGIAQILTGIAYPRAPGTLARPLHPAGAYALSHVGPAWRADLARGVTIAARLARVAAFSGRP